MQNTTKITTSTDHAISEMLAPLSANDAILTACLVLGKNPGDYGHLDNGRRKMCAGNLLRGAARKDDAIVAKVRSEVAHHTPASRPAKVRKNLRDYAPKKEQVAPEVDWSGKSARFKFAVIDAAGEVTFKYTAPAELPEGAVLVERAA